MKIRWKLLILLLAIAILPLAAAGVLHGVWAHRLGDHLAGDTRQILTDNAQQQLQSLAEDYGRILNRDRKVLELSLRIQVREVEQRLAVAAPAGGEIFHSADYDGGSRLPAGMAPSTIHHRHGADGELAAVPVSYEQQAYFVVAGVNAAEKALADDLARLSTMPDAYRRLYGVSPDLMYWQYTALDWGVHTCYPGHGGYPADYDPRVRPWYTRAKQAGELTWMPAFPEVSTRTVILTVSMPVRRPDGSFAGVTAIDVPLTAVFEQLKLPADWAGAAETAFVVPVADGGLQIIAQRSYQHRGGDWRVPVELELLRCDDPAALAGLCDEAVAGRAGVRRMPFDGRPALWAYGAGGADEPFPVVIVPEQRIVAQAVAAEGYVRAKVIQGLQLTGSVMLAVAVLAAGVALMTSRSVTRPVRQLTAAGRKLAGGDFAARVDIRTGDELQQLGEVFNDTGPKLAEHEKLKHSLEVAMEIQQHLLPQGQPALAGFDIAGRAVYCDETGGDYYDFIEMVEADSGKLGIAIGDVTGHGIAAALLMASARGVLRSHAGRYGHDLGKLLAALNTHLYRDTGDERFMTLFYGVLEVADRTLQWASAGHDPAFWLRAETGAVQELPNTGIPLGVVEDAHYGQAGPVSLQSGDVVLVGTDGIWEAANADDELFGKARLRELLTQCGGKSAAAIHSAVVAAVRDFRAAGPQTDDVTLIVVRAV